MSILSVPTHLRTISFVVGASYRRTLCVRTLLTCERHFLLQFHIANMNRLERGNLIGRAHGMHECGLSDGKIAEAVGVSQSAVRSDTCRYVSHVSE